MCMSLACGYLVTTPHCETPSHGFLISGLNPVTYQSRASHVAAEVMFFGFQGTTLIFNLPVASFSLKQVKAHSDGVANVGVSFREA